MSDVMQQSDGLQLVSAKGIRRVVVQQWSLPIHGVVVWGSWVRERCGRRSFSACCRGAGRARLRRQRHPTPRRGRRAMPRAWVPRTPARQRSQTEWMRHEARMLPTPSMRAPRLRSAAARRALRGVSACTSRVPEVRQAFPGLPAASSAAVHRRARCVRDRELRVYQARSGMRRGRLRVGPRRGSLLRAVGVSGEFSTP